MQPTLDNIFIFQKYFHLKIFYTRKIFYMLPNATLVYIYIYIYSEFPQLTLGRWEMQGRIQKGPQQTMKHQKLHKCTKMMEIPFSKLEDMKMLKMFSSMSECLKHFLVDQKSQRKLPYRLKPSTNSLMSHQEKNFPQVNSNHQGLPYRSEMSSQLHRELQMEKISPTDQNHQRLPCKSISQ